MADGERACQFYLLRYVPNIVRGEFVNIGVALFDPEAGRLQPRLLENFRRVRRLHPWADIEVLAALERHIESEAQTPNGGPEAYLRRWQQFSNVLEFTEAKTVLTADPAAELERLFDTYVAEPSYPTRLGAAVERSRAWIRSQLASALRAAGVWERLERGVPVEAFTHKGDRFRFDFGYRQNGTQGYLHSLVLDREVDRAKVLAYTMERIATRLAAEKRAARCTAVVEGPPESDTAELSARILAEQSIATVPVSELGAFTARLRDQLA